MTKTQTTQEQFEEAHRLLDATRPSTEFVKVPRQILVNLLIDHGVILGRNPHD